MRRSSFASLLLAATLAACTPAPPPPEVATQLAAFDAELERDRKSVAITDGTGLRRDFRDRNIEQDIAQFVLSKATLERIDEIRRRAAKTQTAGEATTVLDEARTLVKADLARVPAIVDYWSGHVPGPYWRSYWSDLFRVNEIPARDPDPMLVSIETRAKAALERGDFAGAGKILDELNPVLVVALDRTAGSLVNDVAPPTFLRRKTKCSAGVKAVGEQRKPKLADASSVNDFYPKDAIQRGETGTIVMRVRVEPSGCATHVALVVESGVRSLDAAALEWFETAKFSPASIDGEAEEGEVTFKLKFVLNETPAT
jgi:TonB family protein